MRRALCLLVAAETATAALAWDTKKFNAKALQKEWGLPVFVGAGKGSGVVGNEVTVNDEMREKSAEWALRGAEVKAAVEFYRSKLNFEPRHATSDTSDEIYTFRFPFDRVSRVLKMIIVKLDFETKLVHVRFAQKRVPEGEELDEE